MTRASAEPESILVIGAGIAGLCTALVLAKDGHEVTVLERDAPPPEGDAERAFFDWNRRGAAQFRHPHAFLAVMCNLLEEGFPELVADFFAAGARRVTFADMLPPELRDSYVPEPDDAKMWLLLCRRATMETVFRRYAERQPRIRIESEVNVTGLLLDREGGRRAVRGVRLRSQRGEEQERGAGIVIDAGGRNSHLKRWLQEAGASITTEDDDAEIVYFTRHFKLLPGVAEPERGGEDRSSGDLGYIKFGVFPGDAGHFAVIVCLHNGEAELREAVRDPDQFDRICRAIPGLRPWVAADRAVATTPSFGFGDIHAVWHHFVHDGEPSALNYFAVGDAALRTNPLYGRGCSTGIMHAHLLGKVLRETRDPVQRALRFDADTETTLRPIFKTSLADDRRAIKRSVAMQQGEIVTRPTSFREWFRLAFADAIAMAARRDIRVMRGAMRTFNLMESPGAFLKDWRVLLTAFRFMLHGRVRNAAARLVRGPDRNEMLALLAVNGSAQPDP